MATSTPNLFQLAGKPGFTYQDAHGSHSFTGDQITTTDTPIGTLVTVTLRISVDRGSTTFSLLVPRINLAAPAQSTTIQTYAITTVHKFSIFPGFNHGQTELYTEHPLHGTAAIVAF